MVAASKDPHVEAIATAVARCAPSGERRRDWMYGKNQVPIGYVRMLDDLVFAKPGCPTQAIGIMRLGDAMRDAAYARARDMRVGTPLPEVMEREALVDGQSAAASMRLVGPNCDNLTELHAMADHYARERDAADQARDAVMTHIELLRRQQAAQ